MWKVASIALLGACGARRPEAPDTGRAAPQWIRANFHAHTRRSAPYVGDDGHLSPAKLHGDLNQAGIQLSVHTPHSARNRGPGAARRFRRQMEFERRFPGASLGEELTVAPGLDHKDWKRVAGVQIPGHLSHLGLIGIRRYVAHETPVDRACDAAHEDGGICIVFHPGPGPLTWEPGLWERPGHRERIDAIEVYNGLALASVGLHFEERYRQAIAHRGLGLRVAAVAGSDVHGPRAKARRRKRLRMLALLPMVAIDPALDEHEALTLAAARNASLPAVLDAVRARRTVATFGLADLRIHCDDLGQVRRTSHVSLRLDLSRTVSRIRLWREGDLRKEWTKTSAVRFDERLLEPASYSFSIEDGAGRAQTSGIWYEPPRGG